MKKGILILAVLLLLWGAVDLYHWVTIGWEALRFYGGVASIEELVRYQFFQGLIKTGAGLLLLATCLLMGRRKKRQTP